MLRVRKIASGFSGIVSLGLALSIACSMMAGGVFFAPSASADQVYGANNTWKKIYLSPAYHTAVEGERGECTYPSGARRAERTMARNLAEETATLRRTKTLDGGVEVTDFDRSGLVARGFIVRVGNGDPAEAAARSNNWNAAAHIPLHSNAGLPQNCSNEAGNKPIAGTWEIYRGGDGNDFPIKMRNQIGEVSPGNNDKICTIADCTRYTCLEELCAIDAPSASYSESEFHDWNRGIEFLTEEREKVAVRISRAVYNNYAN